MWKRKKLIKWIRSLIKKIDEHIEAIEIAYDLWNTDLVRYYIREIQTNFVNEIDNRRRTQWVKAKIAVYDLWVFSLVIVSPSQAKRIKNARIIEVM